MSQLLLELFSEEIPARMQPGAARDLERMATERLKAAGLTWDALTTFAGPRRLTLVIEGLPTATPDRAEEIKGPRANAPEQALEGFLRKTGLTRDQLTERDGVLFAVINEAGRPTPAVIAETVEAIVRAFPWPKSMRWADATLRWVRPLKRIVCLFDGAVVPFVIDDGAPPPTQDEVLRGIASGDTTEGHRFMGTGRPLKVRDFADYRKQLEANHVILDVADRKLKILEGARAACHARGLELVDDDGLLHEVAGLAEWPTPILGDMDPQFLDLPPEVVRLSMKVHQKYFAVRDPATGKLAPNFLVVANVEASDGGVALAAGNSRVLSARLNDARFFWDEDLKTGFDAWNAKLQGVTFHAKLGTLAERVDRIAALAREIAPLVGANPDEAERAARLAKADLASGMVGEFPELQGVMGGYYARAFGQSAAVADAIRDHYKPQGPADTVPTAPLTVAVALADKLDTLVGFFAIDEKPTGSKDPFALRRAALGVIRLVLENASRFPFLAMAKFAGAIVRLNAISRSTHLAAEQMVAVRQHLSLDVIEQSKVPLPIDRDELQKQIDTANAEARASSGDLLAFFADRLKVLLRDQGKRHDLVDAVFALGDDDLVRIVRRVEALDAFLATDDGANLLAGYKRASNILKAEAKKGDIPTGMVQTGLPNQPEAETTLAFAADAARTAVDTALDTEDFAVAMTALARLRAPVDAFFTDVMVNSDVAEERDNRLKLLGQVRDVMGRVADFGLVAG
ncbi:Glycine--tRNA ligase beta subunit [Brevundimonas sp. NIBR10]|uniref:glycine--tRNA ligase subunit beta n=1 Tax=Brevundimonas sp. NIBR10 TaxID=3015997 RepID=UPI0022F1A05C|nr:glycine--tRNA ligase subunit beta [Brevundimonas sp. NIBR10]WGM48521.1 Glycine--tRNA ligase beta subunit [Brevundimonas sp. NIBR10]